MCLTTDDIINLCRASRIDNLSEHDFRILIEKKILERTPKLHKVDVVTDDYTPHKFDISTDDYTPQEQDRRNKDEAGWIIK